MSLSALFKRTWISGGYHIRSSGSVGLNQQEDLAIFELAFYLPTLVVAIAACARQGWRRSYGYTYLISLPLFRLTSGSLTIAAYQIETNKTLFTVAAIFTSLGLLSLLLSLTGFCQAMNNNMVGRKSTVNIACHVLHILLIIALIAAIVGGEEYSKNYDRSKHLRQASAIIILVVFIILCAFMFLYTLRLKKLYNGDRVLVYVYWISFPFLLVRLAYTLALAFATNSTDFQYTDPNIWVESFMEIAMECIIIILYLFTAFKRPSKSQRKMDMNKAEAMQNGVGQPPPTVGLGPGPYADPRYAGR